MLQRAKIDGIEAMQMRAQLRWVGHMQRMSIDRMLQQNEEKSTYVIVVLVKKTLFLFQA